MTMTQQIYTAHFLPLRRISIWKILRTVSTVAIVPNEMDRPSLVNSNRTQNHFGIYPMKFLQELKFRSVGSLLLGYARTLPGDQ